MVDQNRQQKQILWAMHEAQLVGCLPGLPWNHTEPGVLMHPCNLSTGEQKQADP